MTDQKTKDVENIWIKYENNLKLLDETLDKLDDQKIAHQNKVKILEDKIKALESELDKLRNKKYDYWGKPKNSKKAISDGDYEKQTTQRYDRLVQEVKAGRLQMNTLEIAEQNIVKKLLDEQN
jgi:chromosome segregation ATPase